MFFLFSCSEQTRKKPPPEVQLTEDSIAVVYQGEIEGSILKEYSIKIGNDKSCVRIEGKGGRYLIKLIRRGDTVLEKCFTIDSLLNPNHGANFSDSLSKYEFRDFQITDFKYLSVRSSYLYFNASLTNSSNDTLFCNWISLCYSSKKKLRCHTHFSKSVKKEEFPIHKVENRNVKGELISIQNYYRDTLHGYWFEYNGIQKDGWYKKGLREGVFRDYYGSKEAESVMLMSFYDNDSVLWYAHPASDQEYFIPYSRGKGFKCLVDSVYLKAPYIDGVVWYEGLFISNKPQGIHKVRYKNGQMKSVLDYDKDVVMTYVSTPIKQEYFFKFR